jgi:hypothetical protein
MVPSEEAGIDAALHKNAMFRPSGYPGIVPDTLNKFVRRPPPEKALTKPEILLLGSTGICVYYSFYM